MGIGSALSGKISPEFLEGIADTPEQAKEMMEKMNQKELSKLPIRLPKELQDLINDGVVKREDFKEV